MRRLLPTIATALLLSSTPAAAAPLVIGVDAGVGLGLTVDALVGPVARVRAGYEIGRDAWRFLPELVISGAYLQESSIFGIRAGVAGGWHGPVELTLSTHAGIGSGGLNYVDVHLILDVGLAVELPLSPGMSVGLFVTGNLVPGEASKTAAWIEVGPGITLRF